MYYNETNIYIKEGLDVDSIMGERIRKERKLLNLTQIELANQINDKFNIRINKGMISKWENGIDDPSLTNIRYLAAFFNVNLAYLVGDSDSRISYEQPTTVAAHLPEGTELTEEEQSQLGEYIDFILSKRKE